MTSKKEEQSYKFAYVVGWGSGVGKGLKMRIEIVSKSLPEYLCFA